MRKQVKLKNLIIIFFLIIVTGCSYNKTYLQTVCVVENLHNGDAKFFNGNIITSVGGKLTLYDIEGNLIETFEQINSNWISCYEDESLVVYGNGNGEVGIASFSSENQLIDNNVIFESSNLCIDPTIVKTNGMYYITFTEIFGNVNNVDVNAENGEYIIHMYCSEDLTNWKYVSDILDEKNNLEDADLFIYNDKFYFVYEQEIVDKGDSYIMLITSSNYGVSWDKPVILLQADCDHEPAAVTNLDEDGFRVYYSSDKEKRGDSYMGGNIYYADFDIDGVAKSVDKKIASRRDNGILLYDVTDISGAAYFLYAGNYLTDCDMVVERGY